MLTMSSGPTQELIAIVPYQASWKNACTSEIAAIRSATASLRMFIDHVGSTAITGLEGKPIIDLLVTPVDWQDADRIVAALTAIGYASENAELGLPRQFLVKAGANGAATSFHVHIAPRDSEWGRNMLVFRDQLAADRLLAQRYAILKRHLAIDYPRDLDAYTEGKSDFVAEVLRRADGAFGNERLLTYQRAELDRSRQFQDMALLAQLGVAVVAAVSVYSDNNAIQLNFALVGFLLAALWLALAHKQRSHRAAGDQARRVILLASGLGERFSAEQRLRVFDGFSVSIEDKPLVREEEHFASREAPGYRRLAELIEESAYWTRDLQHSSAAWIRNGLVGAALLIGCALWTGLLALPTDASISLARVLVAALVFFVSSDLLSSIFAYREAAAAIGVILQRVETAAARDYPSSDIMLLMSDYNAIVESAPFALPGVFRWRNADLTRRWRTYLEQKRK